MERSSIQDGTDDMPLSAARGSTYRKVRKYGYEESIAVIIRRCEKN